MLAADRCKALAVRAWVLCDLSNAIFSVSILTAFFPPRVGAAGIRRLEEREKAGA